MVGLTERVDHTDLAIGQGQQAIVGNDDQRVDLGAQVLDTLVGLYLATSTFESERTSHDTDGERTEGSCNLRDDRRTTVAAITEDLDTGVGRVLAAIDRLGLAGTTYVIYTSDNGSGGGGGKGGGRAGGLSGGKGSVWEGGVRVPFIVRGPGIAANSWCHVPIVGYDLLPTFCEWAGVPPASIPKAVEGGSIAGLIAHQGQAKVPRPRDELLFHFPHYQSGHTPHSAIRVGNLKLIKLYENDSIRLFDLDADPGERDDLAAARPADATRLRRRLEESLAAVQAQLPSPNPDFDPGRPQAPAKRGKRGGKPGKPALKEPS